MGADIDRELSRLIEETLRIIAMMEEQTRKSREMIAANETAERAALERAAERKDKQKEISHNER